MTFRTRDVHEVREVVARTLADLGPHVSAGRLTLPIARAFALHEIEVACDFIRRNLHFGKIVLLPPDDESGTR